MEVGAWLAAIGLGTRGPTRTLVADHLAAALDFIAVARQRFLTGSFAAKQPVNDLTATGGWGSPDLR